MRIRPATARDLPTIAAIYAWYVEHSAATFALEAPSAHDWATDWETAATRGFPWFVGEQDGAVIGYASSGSFFPRRAYDSTVVSSIYLERGHVGQGLGGPLYKTALDALRCSQFHRAVAGITLPNPASIALHKGFGFAPVGTFGEVGRKFGAWRDVSWWELTLD